MNATLTLDEVRRQIYSPVEGPQAALPKTVDVAVIGAGPVGLTLANLLGLYGLDTIVMEQSRVTSEMPKAIILDDEFMRLLDSLGLAKLLTNHVVGPVGIDYFSPLGFTLTGSPGAVTANGFASRSCMAQPMFEKILLDGARQYDKVKICFGAKLIGLKQTDDSVELSVQQGDQAEVGLTAKFVLACDGSHSFVRRSLGLRFPGSNLQSPRMVVDLAEFPDQSLNCRYWCNPSRPINSIPAPYGGRRIEIMLSPGETGAEVTRLENVKRIIARYTPYSVDNLKVARAVVYDFSERVVDHLSIGRVFLLGDAAHIMPPSGGQGLNSGARDAANVAWKLASVIGGRTDRTMLESYHVERWNHVKAVVAFAVRLGTFANLRSWPRALLRDLGFAVGRFVPAVRRRLMNETAPKPYYKTGLFIYGTDGATERVGRIMPSLTLTSPTGSAATLDELVGVNFALIGIDVPGPTLERIAMHATWRTLGAKAFSVWIGDAPVQAASATVPIYHARTPGQVEAISPERGRILVVRPDRYVAAVGTPSTFDVLSDQYGELLDVKQLLSRTTACVQGAQWPGARGEGSCPPEV